MYKNATLKSYHKQINRNFATKKCTAGLLNLNMHGAAISAAHGIWKPRRM